MGRAKAGPLPFGERSLRHGGAHDGVIEREFRALHHAYSIHFFSQGVPIRRVSASEAIFQPFGVFTMRKESTPQCEYLSLK